MSKPDADTLARVFRVLSVETRVRIVRLLKRRALCVNAIAAEIGITPAAVSQHLRTLREAEIVTPDRRGYHVHYVVNRPTLALWKDLADGFLGSDAE